MLEMKDLDHVLKLAHIDISEEDKKTYLPQLQRTLETMKTMDNFDLSDVAPSAHAFNQEAYIREDIVAQGDDLLMEKNAPDWEGCCFSVPSILGDA